MKGMSSMTARSDAPTTTQKHTPIPHRSPSLCPPQSNTDAITDLAQHKPDDQNPQDTRDASQLRPKGRRLRNADPSAYLAHFPFITQVLAEKSDFSAKRDVAYL